MKPFQLSVIFLMLLHGRFGFVRAETEHEVAEGGNITVGCQFFFSGRKYIFCKNNCRMNGDVLVKTSGDAVCEGRHCIEYKNMGLLHPDIMYVTIMNVTESDSGRYQCVVERRTINSNRIFRIKVTQDAACNATYTLKPEDTTDVSPTSDTPPNVQTGDATSVMTVATTQQSSTQGPVSLHTPTSSKHASGSTAMYTGITLAAIAVLLAVALSIFCCNKRHSKPKVEVPVNTEYEQRLEPNAVYEEIPDRRANGPRRVEISTVYASASFRKATEHQPSSDVYSLATAPPAQLQVEDSSDKLVYTEVDFPKSNDSTGNSAPRSQTEAVLYSAVQAQTKDALYSTVSKKRKQ